MQDAKRSQRAKKVGAWAAVLALTAAAFFVVAYPVLTIMPFKAQTTAGLSLSYALRRWSPVATLLIFAAVLALAVWLWRHTRRWWLRPAAALFLVAVAALAWFSRQNHFERWMFAPLTAPGYVRAEAADFVADDEMVLAVAINGDAAAYPVRQIAYHHVVHDVVGNVPVVATY